MIKFKVWGAKTFYRVMLWWWGVWSAIYRFFYHRKYRKVPLSQDLSAMAASQLMRRLKWTKDGAKELGDAVSSPHWVQHVVNQVAIQRPQPKGPLDCDDFAIWAAHVMREEYNAKIFTFAWLGEDDKIHGHAVCLCNYGKASMFHVGNWGQIMGLRTLEDVCTDMLRRAHGKEALAWGLLTKDLKVEAWGKGLPNC